MKAAVNKEFMQDLGRGPVLNLFTAMDHQIVRRALAKLEGAEYDVIRLRFWQNNTVSEIANILDLEVEQVEMHLTHAFEKLKATCQENREFSRASKTVQIQLQRTKGFDPEKAA